MTAEAIAAGISALTPVLAALALAYKRLSGSLGHKPDGELSLRDLLMRLDGKVGAIDTKVELVIAQQQSHGERIARLEDDEERSSQPTWPGLS